MKHTLGYWEDEKVRLEYRPVHMDTREDEIDTFPPKAGVYWFLFPQTSKLIGIIISEEKEGTSRIHKGAFLVLWVLHFYTWMVVSNKMRKPVNLIGIILFDITFLLAFSLSPTILFDITVILPRKPCTSQNPSKPLLHRRPNTTSPTCKELIPNTLVLNKATHRLTGNILDTNHQVPNMSMNRDRFEQCQRQVRRYRQIHGGRQKY